MLAGDAASVLISGAGPTGLAAALFLHERGVRSRIFDKAPAPATTSKALAANPRTLQLLESSGVSDRIRAEGRRVSTMTLRRGGRTVLTVDISDGRPDQGMTIIPQARTEALLTQALAERGVHVERGVELGLEGQGDAAVTVRLKRADGGHETTAAPLLLAADGAHSPIRHALDLAFPGSALPELWELADVVYAGPVDAPDGWVEFLPDGFIFAMAFDAQRTVWRYIRTGGDPVPCAPPGAPPILDVPWRSSFRISHRIAEAMAVGRVALAGDAAHLHSPMGARGMNLGIEDAYVFAACAADALQAGTLDRIADYGRLRREVDAGVVRRVGLMTQVVRGHGPFALVRRFGPHVAARVPAMRRGFVAIATGLDHPLRVS